VTYPYAPQDPQDPNVPQGYLPPADAYYQPAPPGLDPNDPLINPPNTGINGWFTRIGWLFKRSWKSMMAIFAITHILPLVGFGAIGVVAVLALTEYIGPMTTTSSQFPGSTTTTTDELPDWLAFGFVGVFLLILLLVVVFMVLQMAGYAAATYAATRDAIGQPVRLGHALGYGFRRSLGLAGWQIVVSLLVILGAIACILPGIYVYAATALFGPIYLFERSSPISRTFRIFNNNLGRVLGRLAIILAATIVAGLVGNMFDLIGQAATGNSTDPTLVIAAAVIGSLFSVVIQLPLSMFTFAGILLTYTEQRGYEAPVNSGQLATELA
jgi:hypothetical protein